MYRQLRFLLAALCLLAASQLQGQTLTTSGNWSTASNWSTNAVPSGTSTDVTLSANPTITPSITIGNITSSLSNVTFNATSGGGSLTVGSSALFSASTKKNVTLTNGGTITIANGVTIEIWGDLIVTGTFNLSIDGGGKLIVHGNVTISSNASVSLANGTTLTIGGNYSSGSNSSISTNGGSNITVTGSIALGSSSTISDLNGGTVKAASCTCTGCQSQCTGTGITLPVELTLFESASKASDVLLKWVTESEINFNYFEVQRSSDGINFQSIAKVTGHGTTHESHVYEYTDKLPLIGKNYYRLTSVDFDNFQQSFGIILQEYNSEKHFFLSPNPTDGESITISTNFDPAGDTKILLYNNVGYPVGTYDMTSDHALLTFQSPLKSGVYYARYVSSCYAEVVKFIVN